MKPDVNKFTSIFMCLHVVSLILREKRLCWFGHVECSSGAVRTACDIQIEGRRVVGSGVGRSKLIWKKLKEKDCMLIKNLIMMMAAGAIECILKKKMKKMLLVHNIGPVKQKILV